MNALADKVGTAAYVRWLLNNVAMLWSAYLCLAFLACVYFVSQYIH